MSVRHALLALLTEGPKIGLRLREEFEQRTGDVWPLNVGQVYATLQRLEVPRPMVAAGAVGARVTVTDGFGNVQTNATEGDLEAAGVAGGPVLVVNGRRLPRAGTFAELPEREPGIIVDSDGYLAIVVNHGNAATALGLAAGDAVVVEADSGGELGPLERHALSPRLGQARPRAACRRGRSRRAAPTAGRS